MDPAVGAWTLLGGPSAGVRLTVLAVVPVEVPGDTPSSVLTLRYGSGEEHLAYTSASGPIGSTVSQEP